MPNHVHLLVLPKSPLPRIAHWIKGRTTRASNLPLGRTGETFWHDESFDHWAGNAREPDRIAAYIEENPVAAGLAAKAEDWPWSRRDGKLICAPICFQRLTRTIFGLLGGHIFVQTGPAGGPAEAFPTWPFTARTGSPPHAPSKNAWACSGLAPASGAA